MQALIDFAPVVAFAATYWITGDFKLAIMVISIAMVIQLGLTWLLTRKVPRMLLWSVILVLAFGSLSLFLKNDLIFKWKPTVFYWALASAFLISQFAGQQPLAKRMLQSVAKDEFQLPDAGWYRLNLMWAAFFILAGAANITVAYMFSESVWVNFKLFGLLGLTFVFLVLQGFWITRQNETANNTDSADSGDQA